MAAFTTIDDPSAYFKVQLYTGNGAANHAITFDDTDTDMQPDFVWIKNRDTTDSHCLFDAVRGATKVLHSDTNGAETTDTDTLDSFTSDGFQVDADVKVNTNTEKYVAWCWKAGTTGTDLSAGDITPSASSINTTSGIGMYKWAGTNTADQTMAHGLGAVPKMMIVKGTSESYAWYVYHANMGNTKTLQLNLSAVPGTYTQWWQDTSPTSTLYTMGTYLNTGTTALMTYAFTEKQGFSKFGSYEGNGNAADGTFVYVGFRPALIICKSIDSTSSWSMYDDQRLGYNVDNNPLIAESAGDPESTGDEIDILSNGFKFRIASDPNIAETYVYMAWAKAPFVNSNGVPCNAR